MRISVLSSTVLLALVCAAPASAGPVAGKVCSVHYQGASTTRGNAGHIAVKLSTGPDCTGTVSATFYLCSQGATSTSCVSFTDYHHSATSLAVHAQMLRDAADSNQTIEYGTLACFGPYTPAGCLSFIGYRAN